MSARTPRVWGRAVEAPELGSQAIELDTPAWFSWLEATTTQRFTYPVFDPKVGYIVGFMTVRKERRQRGGWYWSVYRRSGGQLRRVYLGRSSSVTRARLEEVATSFRPSHEVDAVAKMRERR
ncbi:MAG: hypothetical protein M3380_08510 [Chloroflexota bacterium]|nr:hypothetical protein [Chloroflexota bacterium]